MTNILQGSFGSQDLQRGQQPNPLGATPLGLFMSIWKKLVSESGSGLISLSCLSLGRVIYTSFYIFCWEIPKHLKG